MQLHMQGSATPFAMGERRLRYSASAAAKATGVSTATITRALQKGKISGEKQADGSWRIDPAELHRVFPALAVQSPATPFMQEVAIGMQGPEISPERLVMQAKIDALTSALEQAQSDRDRWHDMAQRLALAPPKAEQPPNLWKKLFGQR